jgi:hypothetical protein
VKFVNTNTAFVSGYNGTVYKLNVLSGTGIDNEISLSEYSLSQNYPNPFNPVTTIEFSIPKQEFVSLKVYNILGEEISTLVNSSMQTGKYSVYFDGSKLPSGMYFYKLTAGNYSSVKKMMLIK